VSTSTSESESDSEASTSESESEVSTSEDDSEMSSSASEEDSESSASEEDSDVSSDVDSDASELEESASEMEEAAPKKPAPKMAEESNNENDSTVFVGNLAWDATEDDVSSIFKSCGPIRQVRIITDRKTGRSRGIAYVDFEKASSVPAALKLKDKDVLGRPINVDRANPPAAHQGGSNSNQQTRTSHKSNPTPVLFVGNLSYQTTESGLANAFSKFGQVLLTRIPTGADRRPKGFGYVQFKSVEDAQAAMGAQRLEVDGRFVRLDYDSGSLDRRERR
jgi:nucleolin